MRRLLLGIGGAIVVLLVVGFCALPGVVDREMNAVAPGSPFDPSPGARALFATLRVADLHADPLLWPRDLLDPIDHGQVDLPRLLDGNVAVQVFGVATQSPLGQNFERTEADAPDLITALVVAQGWPVRSWGSRLQRALQQSRLLHDAAERSEGRLVVVRTRDDLQRFLEARERDPRQVAGLLGLEGAHALDGQLANVHVLADAGYRIFGLTHFFDNDVAGSSAGEEKHGLTELGRAVVQRAESLGMTIDLAHASPRTIADVLAMATKPVVASHTGVKATCAGSRNLSDDEVRGIAATGGVIGIGYFEGAVCGTSPAVVARAMAYVRALVGPEHVALGSDFDGSVTTAFDTSGLVLLVDALRAEGFDDEEIRLAMGENTLRVLLQGLP